MKLKINNKYYTIIEAKSFKQRLIGLIGKKNITEGMFFPKCNAIHTYFMKENIDVIGLNEENQIIYIYRDVPKNRIVKVGENPKKTGILELPQNASKNLVIGSVLKFED